MAGTTPHRAAPWPQQRWLETCEAQRTSTWGPLREIEVVEVKLPTEHGLLRAQGPEPPTDSVGATPPRARPALVPRGEKGDEEEERRGNITLSLCTAWSPGKALLGPRGEDVEEGRQARSAHRPGEAEGPGRAADTSS